VRERDLFFRVVKAGFSQPRKQLAGNLLALSEVEGSKQEAENWLKKTI